MYNSARSLLRSIPRFPNGLLDSQPEFEYYTGGAFRRCHRILHVRLWYWLPLCILELTQWQISLYGFNCLQTFIYYQKYERDSFLLKGLVSIFYLARVFIICLYARNDLPKVFTLWCVYIIADLLSIPTSQQDSRYCCSNCSGSGDIVLLLCRKLFKCCKLRESYLVCRPLLYTLMG